MPEPTTDPSSDPALDVTAPLSDDPQIIARRSTEDVPRNFARFEDVELVGQGGMASVYRAYDTKLRRTVALKFLRESDPETKERLLHEARAQARVDDTRICSVYDVDELDGRAYVAMQFIEGKTLAEAAREMTLEEKMRVMHDVAEAIHAAHRAGLIHRDLKSNNIMVERSSDGEWLPYVLDFGLARDTAAPGASTAHVMGTPSYMAPEQVRGDRLAIDRRTDVWGLGVTLYEILSGELPFTSSSTFGILAEIVGREPLSLSTRVHAIPADVATIVMKCLEKDPSRRYESARALADDIGRFLDGEPIHARPPSRMRRLSRTLRRNRAAVITAAIALIVVAAFAAFAIRDRLALRERAALEQRLVQDIAQMENVWRFAAMLPAHDIRRDKARVRERIAAIERELRTLPPASAGAARYAIGRGFLALGENERAHAELERAWQSGYQTPAAAYSLGLALAKRFETELSDARLQRPELREARVKVLERQYRDRAVDLLRRARGTGVAEYVEAVLASLQERWPDAIAKADAALNAVPWWYEAERLKGDVYRSMALAARDTGKYDEAKQSFAKADQSYARVLRIAESDPVAHVQLVRGAWEQMYMALNSTFDPTEPMLQRAITHANAAASIDPSLAASRTLLASVWRLQCDALMNAGKDPSDALAQASAAATAALKIEPKNANVLASIGATRLQEAMYLSRGGGDPLPALRDAIDKLRQSLRIKPNVADVQIYLGNALLTQAFYQSREDDARPVLLEAIRQYEAVTRVAPKALPPLNNAGMSYTRLAQWERERGGSPEKYLQSANDAFSRATKINPNLPVLYNNIGLNHSQLGQYHDEIGRDPMPEYRNAIAALERAIAMKTDSLAYFNRAMVYGLMAVRQVDYRRDATEFLDKGEQTFVEGLKLNDKIALAHMYGAWLDFVRARQELQRGRSPEASIARALARVANGLQIDPSERYLIETRAQLLVVRAEYEIAQGRSPERFFAEAEASMKRALEIAPDDAQHNNTIAELYAKWGKWKLAIEHADRAVKANPKVAGVHVTRGRALLAAGDGPRAREAFEQAFRIDPDLPLEARELRDQARRM